MKFNYNQNIIYALYVFFSLKNTGMTSTIQSESLVIPIRFSLNVRRSDGNLFVFLSDGILVVFLLDRIGFIFGTAC